MDEQNEQTILNCQRKIRNDRIRLNEIDDRIRELRRDQEELEELKIRVNKLARETGNIAGSLSSKLWNISNLFNKVKNTFFDAIKSVASGSVYRNANNSVQNSLNKIINKIRQINEEIRRLEREKQRKTNEIYGLNRTIAQIQNEEIQNNL